MCAEPPRSVEPPERSSPASRLAGIDSARLCPNGAGLGTLGFTIPVARALLKKHGFGQVDVVLDGVDNTRWFAATVRAPAPRVVCV